MLEIRWQFFHRLWPCNKFLKNVFLVLILETSARLIFYIVQTSLSKLDTEFFYNTSKIAELGSRREKEKENEKEKKKSNSPDLSAPGYFALLVVLSISDFFILPHVFLSGFELREKVYSDTYNDTFSLMRYVPLQIISTIPIEMLCEKKIHWVFPCFHFFYFVDWQWYIYYTECFSYFSVLIFLVIWWLAPHWHFQKSFKFLFVVTVIFRI